VLRVSDRVPGLLEALDAASVDVGSVVCVRGRELLDVGDRAVTLPAAAPAAIWLSA
jgi:hypothetical protein